VSFDRRDWQSKLVLLLVLPATAINVVLQASAWMGIDARAVAWTLGLSAALGLAAWALRSGTPAAAMTGAVVNASLMFSTAEVPFAPWRTAAVPVLAFMAITALATRFGRARKERLGTAEKRHGRGAAQVAANLGLAALVSTWAVRMWVANAVSIRWHDTLPFFVIGLAALAEAAADTVSSELGQVLGGTPRLLTTLRRVPPGTDGGITLAGSLAGILAAGLVAGAGTLALQGGVAMLTIAWAGAVFGLFFDSLLGATVESADGLNNDAVNFLSTASAAGIAMGLMAAMR
jgi:uncharacterized protein (TIGR00297 family)